MQEKRLYARLGVTIQGTLFIKGIDIPIIINNLSVPESIVDVDNFGIGFQCSDRNADLKSLLSIGDEIQIQFLDNDFDLQDSVHIYKFKITQITDIKHGKLVGAILTEDNIDYSLYTQAKKKIVVAREAEQLEQFLDNIKGE